MYQGMYLLKNCTLMGVVTNFGIGIYFLEIVFSSTKSAARRAASLPIEERARSEPRGQHLNKSLTNQRLTPFNLGGAGLDGWSD